MTFLSPAKINVHLDIGPRRKDGYHDICSWFLMVSLYDQIDIDIHDNRVKKVNVQGNEGVPPEKDLMMAAASLYFEESELAPRCSIQVRKEIPAGAGLGGGSSNAATVLNALNRLHGNRLDTPKLREMALRLGSDVPFFLDGPSAVATGRGEHLTKVKNTGSWWSVIVDPGFSIATGDAFGWFDDDVGSQKEIAYDGAQIKCFAEGPKEKWPFFNAFSQLLYKRYPVLERICNDLIDGGAFRAGITGSGSACYGLFDSYLEAAVASRSVSSGRSWLKETLANSTISVLK